MAKKGEEEKKTEKKTEVDIYWSRVVIILLAAACSIIILTDTEPPWRHQGLQFFCALLPIITLLGWAVICRSGDI